MRPAELCEAVLRAVRQAVTRGVLADPGPLPGDAALRRPARGDADWATGIALGLAGRTGQPAAEIAGEIAVGLAGERRITRATANPAGFVELWVADMAAGVLRQVGRNPRPAAPHPDDPARDARNWASLTGAAPADLLVQREENPLFLVRYAHARARAALRGAARLGLAPDLAQAYLLTHPGERELLALLGEPQGPGASRQPQRRLLDIATAYLAIAYDRDTAALPHGPEKPTAVHRARLALAQATGTVLAGGLYRTGVNAPEHL